MTIMILLEEILDGPAIYLGSGKRSRGFSSQESTWLPVRPLLSETPTHAPLRGSALAPIEKSGQSLGQENS